MLNKWLRKWTACMLLSTMCLLGVTACFDPDKEAAEACNALITSAANARDQEEAIQIYRTSLLRCRDFLNTSDSSLESLSVPAQRTQSNDLSEAM